MKIKIPPQIVTVFLIKANGNYLPTCQNQELLQPQFGFQEKAGGLLEASITKSLTEYPLQIYIVLVMNTLQI